MYLFTRRRRLHPARVPDGLAYAAETAGRVTEITGRPVNAWVTVMSPELGTITWSSWAEHLADIEQALDKLVADAEFTSATQAADELFEGPIEDGLTELVFGEPATDAPPAYATVVRATAANGRFTDAMTGGVEIAEAAAKITGVPTLFGRNLSGDYAGVGWITGVPDIDALERTQAALAADASWLALVDRVSPSYGPDATQTILRHLG